jgi:hypothetical protein
MERPCVPAASAHPLRKAAFVIYLTLTMLAIAIPQSLVNWLGDMNGNPVQEMLLRGAEALRYASEQAGIAIPYLRAREAFIAAAGVEAN